MAKLMSATMMLMFFVIVIGMLFAQGIAFGPKGVEKWFEEKLPQAKQKLTKIHFYLHDTLSGKNPTAIPVAQANITSSSPTLFGSVVVIDDPLTVEPDPNSKIIGRAQGVYALASQEELSLLLVINFIFTEGKHNGSTLSILGQNPIRQKLREMPILGGTGVFRLARGIANVQTYTLSATSGDAVVRYHLDVLHYE